jgi:phosphoglycerate kinase
MAKRSISDLSEKELIGKRVLVRVDFNVPMDKAKVITDDTRIKESLPTIKYLVDKGAKVILVSHLGRPKGITEDLRMDPVAKKLEELLKKKVLKLNDSVGQEVEQAISKLNNGDVCLLENIRFYKEEEANDEQFARKLADLADIYVNDAFGTAHRAHASTAGVAAFLPAYCGFLIQKELDIMGKALTDPKRPFVAIIGGAKISSKIGVLKHLLGKVDTLIIGGGMLYTFLKARGLEVGKSLVEDNSIDQAKIFLASAQASKTKVVFATDVVVSSEFSEKAIIKTVPVEQIPPDMMGMDTGPESIKVFKEIIKTAGTVVWNGPVGVFEMPKFAKGTNEIARALAESKAITIIGGGDSAAAVEASGVADKITHISTGGGASLEFLEGKELPGIAVLQDK